MQYLEIKVTLLDLLKKSHDFSDRDCFKLNLIGSSSLSDTKILIDFNFCSQKSKSLNLAYLWSIWTNTDLNMSACLPTSGNVVNLK